MGLCWGYVEEGVRIEVLNSDTNLSTKVYWIAEIIKLAGENISTIIHPTAADDKETVSWETKSYGKKNCKRHVLSS